MNHTAPGDPLTATEEAYDVADDLVRDLAPVCADPGAVEAELRGWLDRLGGRRLGLVSAAALRTVFAECLTDVPATAIPPGAVGFTRTKETA